MRRLALCELHRNASCVENLYVFSPVTCAEKQSKTSTELQHRLVHFPSVSSLKIRSLLKRIKTKILTHTCDPYSNSQLTIFGFKNVPVTSWPQYHLPCCTSAIIQLSSQIVGYLQHGRRMDGRQ